MTNSKKDSELKDIFDGYQRYIVERCGQYSYIKSKKLSKKDAIQAINSNYITKEESDRRVLEARINELQTHGDQWRVWLDDTKNVKLKDVVNWYDLRIAELRELLNGDTNG